MQVFQDMTLRGPHEAIRATVEGLQPLLRPPWSRDFGREEEMRRAGAPAYCFSCPGRADELDADVYLAFQGDEELRVINIVPTSRGSLTEHQYNLVLGEFYNLNVRQNLAEGVTAELTPADESIEDWTGADAAQKLRTFSALANRITGAGHPLDKARWHAFIVAAHRAPERPSTDYLGRWLVEEEGWPDGEAHELILDYERALSLLRFYDAHPE